MQYKRKRAGLLKSALLGAATLGAISLAGAGVARAGQIDFNFGSSSLTPSSYGGGTPGTCSSPTGTCKYYASPVAFTNGGITLKASAEIKGGNGADVTQTTTSSGNGSELGLGVHSTLDTSSSGREIDPGEYLILDMSSFMSNTNPYYLKSISLGSIQSGEGGQIDIYGSSSDSLSSLSPVASLTSNTGGALQTYMFTNFPAYDYLIITTDNIGANQGNVLVSDLVVNTPEPGSLALLGTGLLGLGLVARRRRRRKAA